MSQRTQRLDELLRQEIGEILAREVADPRVGFVTITEVDTAPDLRHARVWVSILGTSEEREAALEGLDRAMGFIRRELGHRLRLKRVPELHVRLDDSAERGTRVLRLISQLESGDAVDELAEPALPSPVPRIGREGDAPEAGRAVDGPAAAEAPDRSTEGSPPGRGSDRTSRSPRRARSSRHGKDGRRHR